MRTLLLLCLTLLASTSHAKLVTYMYQGAQYDYILNPQDDPTAWANPYQYAAQKSVAGFMILDTDKLPGGTHRNVSYETFLPNTWECEHYGCESTGIYYYSFFDGVYVQDTYRNYAAAWQLFSFRTDARGDLTSWLIDLEGDPDLLQISHFGDQRRLSSCGDSFIEPWVCASSSTSGKWTQVPEPGALALMGALLLIVGATRGYVRRPPSTP